MRSVPYHPTMSDEMFQKFKDQNLQSAIKGFGWATMEDYQAAMCVTIKGLATIFRKPDWFVGKLRDMLEQHPDADANELMWTYLAAYCDSDEDEALDFMERIRANLAAYIAVKAKIVEGEDDEDE